MGLIDFVKNAGEDLLGRVRGNQVDTEAISKKIHDLGLGIENLNLSVDDDKATISGTAPSQEIREKAVLVVGNTKGIAAVDDRLDVAARYHTVEKGDTLSKIAKKVYGDPMKYPAIFEANRPMLKDPDKIYPGQKLRIPDVA